MNLETPQWTTREKMDQVHLALQDFDIAQILKNDVLECALSPHSDRLRNSVQPPILLAALELNLATLTRREEFELCGRLCDHFPELVKK